MLYKADYKFHLQFNKINPFMLIHKLPFQKRKYKKEGIDIYREMNEAFKDPNSGISSMRAGGLMFGISALFGIMLFNIFDAIFKDSIDDLFMFVITIPFFIIIYYLLFHKDKYLIYFEEFEKKPKQWKKKWAWVSFISFFLVVLFLIESFNFYGYATR